MNNTLFCQSSRACLSLLFFLTSFLPITAADALSWRPCGNVKKITKGTLGEVYQFSANNLEIRKSENIFHSLSVALFKNRKDRKKNSKKFCSISFKMRIFPFMGKYNNTLVSDHDSPYYQFCIGWSDQFSFPQKYSDMTALCKSFFYNHAWSVWGTRGLQQIVEIDPRRKLLEVHHYWYWEKDSIMFAPVDFTFIYDKVEGVLIFYINGHQHSIELSSNSKKLVGDLNTFSILWNRPQANKKFTRTIEISSPIITHFDHLDAGQFTGLSPASETSPQTQARNYDAEYVQAMELLYSSHNNWLKGFQILSNLAKEKHALALYEMGCCYYRGIGCVKNSEKAVDCLLKAAEYGVLEAGNLYLLIRGLSCSDPNVPRKIRHMKLGDYEITHLVYDNELTKISGNIKKYAVGLKCEYQRMNDQQKREVILNELISVAKNGYPPAMVAVGDILLKNKQKQEALAYYHAALKSNDADAIKRIMRFDRSFQNRMTITQKLAFAEGCPLEYAGIESQNPRDNLLLLKKAVLTNPKAAFVYSEYLLKQLNPNAYSEAKMLMKKAAETCDIAKIRYLQRFLEGGYGQQYSLDVSFLSDLKRKFPDELIIMELDALTSEFQSPGKNRQQWEKLASQGSIPALFHLGEYAYAAGDKKSAAFYRYEFLKKDNSRRNAKTKDIYWGMPCQKYGGSIKLP